MVCPITYGEHKKRNCLVLYTTHRSTVDVCDVGRRVECVDESVANHSNHGVFATRDVTRKIHRQTATFCSLNDPGKRVLTLLQAQSPASREAIYWYPKNKIHILFFLDIFHFAHIQQRRLHLGIYVGILAQHVRCLASQVISAALAVWRCYQWYWKLHVISNWH